MNQKQLDLRAKYGFKPTDNLNDFIVPKNEISDDSIKTIRSSLTKQQKEMVVFHTQEGKNLNIKQVNPRNNKYNSVRYQSLKNSGHYLGEYCKAKNCDICGYIMTCTYVDFITYGDDEKKISSSLVRCDDVYVIGHKGSLFDHMISKHPETAMKRLKKIGVTIKAK